MQDDQVKGRIRYINGEVNNTVGKAVGGDRAKGTAKVEQPVRKTRAGYGDLRTDLQRLWVIF